MYLCQRGEKSERKEEGRRNGRKGDGRRSEKNRGVERIKGKRRERYIYR